MIETRDANTDDEAWMLEKINQEGQDLDSFNPREFRLAVDEDTGQRMAFGRTEFIRNVDDSEFIEINSVYVLERAELKDVCILVADLANKATTNRRQQVFAFPHEYHEQYEEVGFREMNVDQLPEVMQEKFRENQEQYEDVVAMTADLSSIEYEVEDDEDDEFEKPEGTTEEEVEQIKDELDIDEGASTKYEV